MIKKRWIFCVVPAFCVLAAAAQPPARVLAPLPEEVRQVVPVQLLREVEEGQIPWELLAQGLGFPANPQAVSEIEAKRFVVHWLYHYTGLPAAITEDPVGEAGISGRCSTEKITDAEKAPNLYPSSWSAPGVGTHYWQAPTDSTTCTTDTTDLTFYKLTWVRSPSAQPVQAWFGSSDYFKLWINGTLVGSRTSGGPKPYTVDEYKYSVNLQAGWNLVVVRQTFPQLGPGEDPDPNNRSKYFSLRFVRDAAGTPVTNLVASFDPNPSCDERGGAQKGLYTKLLVPSVAHLTGVGGSQWRTDLEIYNAFPWPFEWRFAYFKEGNNSGIPDATRTITLEPFETVVVSDALRSSGFFNVAGDEKGYAWVSGPYYWWLKQYQFLQVKLYNQAATGTFAMGLPVWYPYDYSWSSYFYNVRNGAFRTNLAIIPLPNQGSEYRVRLTLFGPDFPTPIVKEWPENPSERMKGFAQLNNVFAYMGAGSVNTARAHIFVEFLERSSGTSFFPYVTVNDQGTSDPLFRSPGFYAAVAPF